MIEWVSPAAEYLWHNGLSAIPLVLMVTAATRWLPCRPSTKHLLWVMVLGWLVTPPLIPGLPGIADPVEPEPVLAGPHEESSPAVEGQESKAKSRKSKVANRRLTVRPADPIDVSASRSTVRPASKAPNRLARVPEAAGPKTNGDRKSGGTSTLRESRRPKNYGRRIGVPQGTFLRFSSQSEHKQQSSDTGWSALDDSRLGFGRGAASILERPLPYSPGTDSTESDHRFEHAERINTDLASGAGVTETDHASPPGTAPPSKGLTASVAWLAGLTAVRDAVGRLPAIPTSLWIIVAGALLSIGGLRVFGLKRLLRRGRPAPRPWCRASP